MSDQYINCTEVTAQCPVEATNYGYYPSLAANTLFLALFATLFAANLGLGVWYKTWTYTVALCCACLLETLGYVGRVMLHHNPWSNSGFIMQICCIIIGPAFNSAAIYLTLKYVALTFGPETSRIRPWLYTWIFIGGDLISLIFQAAGGAMASTATKPDTLKTGDDIAMAGICWQVFTLALFGVATLDYAIRRMRSTKPLSGLASSTLNDPKFQLFAVGITLAWLTVLIRCIYRIVEFAAGWGNPIMQNQTYFIILEGSMIVIATVAQTIPHPGFCFPALSFRTQPLYPNELKRAENQNSLSSQDTLTDSRYNLHNRTQEK